MIASHYAEKELGIHVFRVANHFQGYDRNTLVSLNKQTNKLLLSRRDKHIAKIIIDFWQLL